MNWHEAISQIESPEFDANLNVVSSMDAFFRAADSEPAVREAYRHLLGSGQLREEVLDRIYDLAVMDIDTQYENPNDTALAVLLWLSYFAFPDDAGIAIDYVSRAPQCWYAAKLARCLVTPLQTKGDNYYAVFGDMLSHWGPNSNSLSERVQTKPISSGSKLRLRASVEVGVAQSDMPGDPCARDELDHVVNYSVLTQYKAEIADNLVFMMRGSKPANSITFRVSLSPNQRDNYHQP